MVAEVDIANSAFRKIGVKQTITSFSDGTPAANFASDRYDALRDELLRMHLWNFAMKRVKPAASTTLPVFEYDNAFPLPSDWLRTVRVYDNDNATGTFAWREEAGSILASREEIWILYVSQVTDPNVMTADFREALAYALAVEGAINLVNSRTLSETMEERFNGRLLVAKGIDAQSDGARSLPRGTWVTSRTRGTNVVASTS